jgi:hypothetical protein
VTAKDYKQWTSQHAINLELKNYSDDNAGGEVVMMFHGVHLILTSCKKQLFCFNIVY